MTAPPRPEGGSCVPVGEPPAKSAAVEQPGLPGYSMLKDEILFEESAGYPDLLPPAASLHLPERVGEIARQHRVDLVADDLH